MHRGRVGGGRLGARHLRNRCGEGEEESKQLEEQVDREEPPQIVRERYSKVAAALLPDPDMSDGRGPWIKAQIPHNHQEGSNKRNGKSRERAGLATDISNNDVLDRPREAAGSSVGRPDKHGNRKNPGAE